MKRTLLPTAH